MSARILVVDEAWQRPDCAREEGRSRARGADDEYESVVEPSDPFAERRPSAEGQTLRDAKLEGR